MRDFLIDIEKIKLDVERYRKVMENILDEQWFKPLEKKILKLEKREFTFAEGSCTDENCIRSHKHSISYGGSNGTIWSRMH